MSEGSSRQESSQQETLTDISQFATRIAEETGSLLMDLFHGPLEIEFKDRAHLDPVSQADKQAEAYLRQRIEQRFPEHAILGEEGEDSGPPGAEYVWVLDPLDGTSNYINRLPLFSVSVGVLRRGCPVVGAIWAPVSPTGGQGVFSAQRDGGAFLNGERIYADQRQPGFRRNARRLGAVPGGSSLLLTLMGPAARRAGEPRTLGSIALEAALVAAGVLRYGIFGAPHIWDIAAGVTIVQEAGASALSRQDGPWQELTLIRPRLLKSGKLRPLREWSASVIVAPPPLAGRMAAMLRPTPFDRAARLLGHPSVQRLASTIQRHRAPGSR